MADTVIITTVDGGIPDITVTLPSPVVTVAVEVPVEPSTVTIDVGSRGERGERGEQGAPGDSIAFEYAPPTPSATWTIVHNFGRRPNIAVYIAGEYVLVSIEATTTTATITFPSPTTGTAVLT